MASILKLNKLLSRETIKGFMSAYMLNTDYGPDSSCIFKVHLNEAEFGDLARTVSVYYHADITQEGVSVTLTSRGVLEEDEKALTGALSRIFGGSLVSDNEEIVLDNGLDSCTLLSHSPDEERKLFVQDIVAKIVQDVGKNPLLEHNAALKEAYSHFENSVLQSVQDACERSFPLDSAPSP